MDRDSIKEGQYICFGERLNPFFKNVLIDKVQS